MDRLETSKLDGSARVSLLEQVTHPFGLTQVSVVVCLHGFWAAAPIGDEVL